MTSTYSRALARARIALVLVAALTATLGLTATADRAQAAWPGVGVGLTVPYGPITQTYRDQVAAIGKAPRYVMWFAGFKEPRPDLTKMATVKAMGSTPVISFEPWVAGQGLSQPKYSMDKIAGGTYDAYFATWAKDLATVKGTVLFRFAHEMNGNWFPWGMGVNGTTPASYVAAWRHVHDIFVANGAKNVKWIWAPNQIKASAYTLESQYPGNAYVDILGVDAYNWGTTQWWSVWSTPAQIYDATFAKLRSIGPGKQLVIAETSSVEQGGRKAAWVQSLFDYCTLHQDVIGFFWFDNSTAAGDWRVASSPTSLAAFKKSVATS
jgi:beta-mannanase